MFDFETLDRKKSKQVISFPPVIDMNEYIGDRSQSEHVDELLSLYELRGVLLHKGASAHHGHYEAQVYNSRYVLKVSSLDEVDLYGGF